MVAMLVAKIRYPVHFRFMTVTTEVLEEIGMECSNDGK